MLRNSIINFTLKLGLAFSLFYAGLAAFVVPDHVLSFWPLFISKNANESALVFVSGFCSFALIGWLFSKKMQFSSAVTTGSAIALVGLFNITNVPFIVDLAPLFFISLGLSFRYYPRIRVIAQTKVTSLASVTVHENMDDDQMAGKDSDLGESVQSIVESGVHTEHDQHIFIPKH
jgi:hypothetical protein